MKLMPSNKEELAKGSSVEGMFLVAGLASSKVLIWKLAYRVEGSEGS